MIYYPDMKYYCPECNYRVEYDKEDDSFYCPEHGLVDVVVKDEDMDDEYERNTELPQDDDELSI